MEKTLYFDLDKTPRFRIGEKVLVLTQEFDTDPDRIEWRMASGWITRICAGPKETRGVTYNVVMFNEDNEKFTGGFDADRIFDFDDFDSALQELGRLNGNEPRKVRVY